MNRRDDFGMINAHHLSIIFLEHLVNVILISAKSLISCSNRSMNDNDHATNRVSGLLPKMNDACFNKIELQKYYFMDKKEI